VDCLSFGEYWVKFGGGGGGVCGWGGGGGGGGVCCLLELLSIVECRVCRCIEVADLSWGHSQTRRYRSRARGFF